ncbi:hypothetical protein SAMD00019534_121160, partial [Acytostelium subglobosum LB1]|uniref:hypothetical protein n=1 Tax=Acytostelium subglobosum LB1 TaxID=1410327 RepID=UPI000644FF8D
MDDLDLLLADLGSPKSGVAKPAPAASNGHNNHNSSKVNLNEIESLMSDLQTTGRQEPTHHNHHNNNNSTSQQAFESSDDLDALMESLNTSIHTAVKTNEPASQKTYSSSAKPAPLHAAPVKTYTSTASVVVKKPQVSRAVLETTAPAQRSAPAPIHSSASHSTDDLDELLKNLNPQQPVVDYKQAAPAHQHQHQHQHHQHQPQHHHQQAAAAPRAAAKPAGKVVAGDDLDNLLTNLTSQMNDIDTTGPTPRGTCGHCRKPILGETIQAMGKLYHPEHFVCHNCHNPIGTKNFYEQENFPHCEKCYHELFCSRCAHCDDAITDRCITALGKKWHIHHFVCTQCLKPFEDGNFFERDGRPY